MSSGSTYIHELSDATACIARGADVIDLLQRISTNDMTPLHEGKDVETIFTTEKGRIFEFVHVVPLPEHQTYLLLLAGCFDGDFREWLSRFIIMEDIELSETTAPGGQWVLYSEDFTAPELPQGSLESVRENGFLALEEHFRGHRWVRIVEREAPGTSERLMEALTHLSVRSNRDFDISRLRAGIPFARKEFSDLFNPLEALAREFVSFTKGCYVGQEVIARLDSYKKVSRVLVRMEGDGEGSTGVLLADGKEGGIVTSVAQAGSSGWIGLGYVKEFVFKAKDIQIKGKDSIIRLIDKPTADVVYGSANV